MRGLRTLHARLRCHEENTQAIVKVLANHTAVSRVHYPGLSDHPDYHVARGQQSSFGAIISFELEGDESRVRAFLDGLNCFTLAESLGGVESLVCHPATMTHAALSETAQQAAGIELSLLRLSVGIEHVADLVNDIASALNRAGRVANSAMKIANCA